MKGSTHLILGATSSLVLITNGQFDLVYLVLGALGGLLPDIDASEAKIHHLGFGSGKTRIEPLYIPAKIMSSIFRHRGWIHSLLGLLIFSFIFYMIVANYTSWGWPFVIAFVLGYFSHLIVDSMTKSGVPLFYPWKKKIHILPKPLRLKTGGVVENTFEFILVLVLAVSVIYLLSNNYIDIQLFQISNDLIKP